MAGSRPVAAILGAFALEGEIAGRPLDACQLLHEVQAQPRQGWDCVAAYPPACYCPFCRCDRFTWEDGGTGLYDASGRCSDCRAEVDFRDEGGAS